MKTGGYILSKYPDTSEGSTIGSKGIDISKYHVGYIDEIKKSGIVTMETLIVDDPDEPQAKHGVRESRVYAYTVEAII